MHQKKRLFESNALIALHLPKKHIKINYDFFYLFMLITYAISNPYSLKDFKL